MKRLSGPRSQAGIGIIEIMVAMAISLTLLAGLVQVFVSQKQGFLVQESQARLQENARLVSMILSSNIAKAGFHADPVDGSPPAISIIGTNNAGAAAGDADDITIRFVGDGFLTDCLGTTVTLNTTCTNQFQINGTDLECVSTGCGNNQTRTLIGNVEDMQILYGEDTSADTSVDGYVTRDNVANLNNVLSVHIALLMASEGNVKPAPNNQTYTLLDKTLTNHPATPDQIQRRVIERVIALRNRLL